MDLTQMNKRQLRAQAKRAAKLADRQALIDIANGGAPAFYSREAAIFAQTAAKQELIDRYPCIDCGVPAGTWCRPDYGCLVSSRRD